MLVAGIVSDITTWVTDAIGNYGLYAVFLLMLIDAVFPAASEVVMVYGGAVASGAFAGQAIDALRLPLRRAGCRRTSPIALAGHGRLPDRRRSVGWAIGDYRGRPWLERHGRWLHLSAEKLDRAERVVRPLGGLGRVPRAHHAGRCARSSRFRRGSSGRGSGRYVWLTLLGSAIWCFAFAGAGWAAGASWESFHHAFRFVDYVVALAVVGARRAAGDAACSGAAPVGGRRAVSSPTSRLLAS